MVLIQKNGEISAQTNFSVSYRVRLRFPVLVLRFYSVHRFCAFVLSARVGLAPTAVLIRIVACVSADRWLPLAVTHHVEQAKGFLTEALSCMFCRSAAVQPGRVRRGPELQPVPRRQDLGLCRCALRFQASRVFLPRHLIMVPECWSASSVGGPLEQAVASALRA